LPYDADLLASVSMPVVLAGGVLNSSMDLAKSAHWALRLAVAGAAAGHNGRAMAEPADGIRLLSHAVHAPAGSDALAGALGERTGAG
jgi:hypothetical protein